jgi:Mrp family chromosome partitioning ATPase
VKRSRHYSVSPWQDLAARLVFHARGLGKPGCYLVTSGGPREGKSTVCRQVAALAAAPDWRVGVLEITSPERGGHVSLAGRESPVAFEADHRLGYAVWTLPDSFAALPRYAREPREWLASFDMLLIDAPVVGSFMQQHLTPLSDGVILVVDSRKRRLVEVQRTVKAAIANGGTFMGVVLNRHESPLPRWLDRWGDVPR